MVIPAELLELSDTVAVVTEVATPIALSSEALLVLVFWIEMLRPSAAVNVTAPVDATMVAVTPVVELTALTAAAKLLAVIADEAPAAVMLRVTLPIDTPLMV